MSIFVRKLNMKWSNIIALLCCLTAGILFVKITNQNKIINRLETLSLRRQVDTVTLETENKVIEYKIRKSNSEKIVNKWILKTDTVEKTDTLFVEYKRDIISLDSTLSSCDAALMSCLNLNNLNAKLIKKIQNKKTPIIVPYAGIGLSANRDLNITPSIQMGIGFNLNKLFKNK